MIVSVSSIGLVMHCLVSAASPGPGPSGPDPPQFWLDPFLGSMQIRGLFWWGVAYVSERTERSKCKTLASLLEYMHTKKLSAVYTEFYKLLEICATIPVTSACNERSHSKLKLIKTETRSTSGDERTEALLVIAVEKQICNALSLSSLVDTFALKPRKLKL
jgi:hypothetical protein